uniref:sulfite reductase subunit alpha n=1 Tax=Crateriforma conspicua TaxID=2527996 RepID=UPI0011A189D6
MHTMSSFIPESAPFNEEQRAWLNGFFAGLTGIQGDAGATGQAVLAGVDQAAITAATVEEQDDDCPWHDPSLPIVDRMDMAADRPLKRKLMAAMAQLDCGSCGYVCESYAEAIASGDESNLSLCSPGGKETKQMIKRLLADAPAEANGASSGNGSAMSNGNTAAKNGDSGYSRKNPFTAKLLESRCLNLEGSAKDTRHVVIDLVGSGMKYNVGDALGVYPTNCGDLVEQIVRTLAADPNVSVESPLGGMKPFAQSLCEDCCLKDPSDELLELLASRVVDDSVRDQLNQLIRDGVPDGFDVLDALEIAKDVRVASGEFIERLEPLNPRLYSIASSMKAVGDQVHLTVGKVTYDRTGRTRKGVASTMLADRVPQGDSVRVFVQPNHAGFTVPSDPACPMIMVGPGTGIAPFIAFLQERAATKATGENWLFFGDQHESSDFLYREDLQQYKDDGVLTRLDTAFSRDSEQKLYVQDRMAQNASELYQWLQRGACFYICGDASRMAKDVDRTLRKIIADEGQMSPEAVDKFVDQMIADGRYHRDVY